MNKIALLALAAIALSTPSLAKTHRHHHVYRETFRHRIEHRDTAMRRIDRREAAERRIDHRQTARRRLDGASAVSRHAQITCGMVRAYVAQVGLAQARAMAQSAGITASEEQRAIRCLENKI